MLFRFYTHWRDSYSGIPRNIWFLSLITLVNRCGAMVIAFIMLYLKGPLHFSLEDAGFVMACFGAGALAGGYLGGRLTDRWGYYWVQIWSLALNGLALLVMMLVRDFWWMCGMVFTMSLISEAFRPANSVAINVHCTPETRTRSVSLYRMAANIGWAVAPVMGGLLVAAGWHWLFWVDGLTCIAAALMVYRLLPPSEEPKIATAAVSEEATAPAEGSPYRDGPFLWFIFLTMLNAIVFMQFLWTVPVFFKDGYGWSEQQIGFMAALNGIIVFMVEMPLIYRIERHRPPLYFVRIGLILYAVAYLAFQVPPGGLWSALMYTVAISLGEIFVMPFSSNHVYSSMAASTQGQYLALYTMAYSVANIIAPLLGTQVVAAWGYSALWYGLAAVAGLAWLGIWDLQRRQEAKLLARQPVFKAET